MKTINVILFGIGNVGSTLIRQVQQLNENSFQAENFKINMPVIANSRHMFYDAKGLNKVWEADFKNFSVPYKIDDIVKFVKEQGLHNIVAVDATASSDLVNYYGLLIENGCHIVAANKIANSLSIEFYNQLRRQLKTYNRQFYYSTNVGAGLPVLSTLKALKQSGDEVLEVRGVFSGSLSYLFNEFSEGNQPFSNILDNARKLGYTEPDPRIDLSGVDVARKLLIIARELNINLEFKDIEVQSLVPKQLNGQTSLNHFNQFAYQLDNPMEFVKSQNNTEVLRYIARLNVKQEKAEVKLISVPKNSNFGLLKGANNIFEIYSKQYNEHPLVISGAGAGREVTASGILKDLLAISQSIVNV